VTEPTIRAARTAEIPSAGHLIAVAFNELDANAYLVPPLADRVPVMAGFFTQLTEVAAEHGRVDVVDGTDGPVATAVWFDYTQLVPEQADFDNIRLYRRAGYREMDPFEVYLPDGTPFFRMWRPAG
jgi:hypothetical protein